ncbi:MAG: TonB-dependent receptor [Acidobacteria bacterium]|nr:TonB-dependent receptor [Acidobacteriota bacterium]
MTGAKKVLGVLTLCSWVVVVVAQVTTGTISGTVADSSGAVLPGTTVVVLNEETGVSRTVAANAEGRYSAPSLNVGRYRITASLAGFQTEARSGIVLTVGRQAVVDFQLQVGAVTETVEVTGEAPLVETTQSAVHALVDARTISELPLNGRDLAQLVLLQPGVTQTEQASTAVHRGFGTQINISGARSDENVFLLDGTDIADFRNSAPVGPNGIMFGVGSVREFQVQTSTFSAQYGRSLGGVFNAVSKSGTNAFNGEVFESFRNNTTDARSFFDINTKAPPFRRNQFGGGLGGPIVRDKAFFHASYEGLRSTQRRTSRPAVPGPELRQGILPNGRQVPVGSIAASIIPIWPLPTAGGRQFSDGTAEYIVETPLTVRSDYVQGRVDHQLSETDSIFGRLTILDLEQHDTNATPGYGGVTKNGSWFATISNTHIFSPRDLNTVRFAFNRNTMTDDNTAPDIPQLKFFPDAAEPGNFSVSGIGMGFSLGLFPFFAGITNRFEVMDDVMLQRGDHAIQFGGNLQRLQAHQVFPNVPYGQYSFRSWEGFLLNRTTDLGQFRGSPASLTDWVRGMRYWYFSGYLQDDWRVRPNLTLNLGLRYDFQSVPTEVNGKISNFRQIVPGGDLAVDGEYVIGNPLWLNPTTKNFAPRFGFAWTPWAERSTTVRGGFGIFFGRLDFRAYSPNRDGFIAKAFAVSLPQHFPNGLAEIAASQTHQVDNVVYDMDTPHTLQWNLDTQQQLGQSMVLAVSYTGTRGINLLSVGNFNAPPSTFVDGVLTIPAGAGPRNPQLETFQTISANTDSWYHGLGVGFNRRMAAGLQFQVSYTRSKSISMAEQTSRAALVSNRTPGHVLDVGHLDADKSLSPWDSRNVFKFNYVLELPWGLGRPWLNSGWVAQVLGGWDLSGILTLKDGSPYTYEVTVSRTLAGASVVSQRPNAKPGEPVGGTILGTPADQCNGQPCLRYYDPNSFAFPGARQLGNLGRFTGIAPGIATFDASLQKSFSPAESMKLQLRVEGFNLLNRVNFGLPGRTVFAASGQVQGSAGVINNTAVGPRQFQFGLKMTF